MAPFYGDFRGKSCLTKSWFLVISVRHFLSNKAPNPNRPNPVFFRPPWGKGPEGLPHTGNSLTPCTFYCYGIGKGMIFVSITWRSRKAYSGSRNHNIYKGVFPGHLQLSFILLTVATMVDLRNQITVQRSVLDGFGEVSGEDIFLALEIGNGSGNL